MKNRFAFWLRILTDGLTLAKRPKLKKLLKAFAEWLGSEEGILVWALLVGFAAVWMLGGLCGGDGFSLAVSGIAGVAGVGQHISGDVLTTGLTEEVSPGLLRNEIDDRIVKIRPMSTPLDQISRYGGGRLCGSMKVEYYSVDTKPTSGRLSAGYDPGAVRDISVDTPATLVVDDGRIFEPSTTIMVPSVKSSDGGSLVLYVITRDGNSVRVMAVNNSTSSGMRYVPAIASGAVLIRMGRAATELDVMTPQFEVLPTKAFNYCQIFK